MIVIAKLDWTITSLEKRLECVNEVLAEIPSPNSAYLELMGTYLVECMEKQERREHKILTENRLATINKRETSLEGLISQFENGEDGIYNLLVDSNKNTIFRPKVTITRQDIEEIPPLRQKRESILFWENQLKSATGHAALVIKQTIIELRKDQYLIKDCFRRPLKCTTITRTLGNINALPSNEWVNENDEVCYSGISLCDKRITEHILCNYQSLCAKSEGNFLSDLWYLLEDFRRVYRKALYKYPMYHRLVQYKMDLYTNAEIQTRLREEFGFSHSIEYLSSLWRNKIPQLIAMQARADFLVWYHTNEVKSHWKKCSRCGQIKLAHNYFFSINKTSKDGFYSICKVCRNQRQRGAKSNGTTILLHNMQKDNGC